MSVWVWVWLCEGLSILLIKLLPISLTIGLIVGIIIGLGIILPISLLWISELLWKLWLGLRLLNVAGVHRKPLRVQGLLKHQWVLQRLNLSWYLRLA